MCVCDMYFNRIYYCFVLNKISPKALFVRRDSHLLIFGEAGCDRLNRDASHLYFEKISFHKEDLSENQRRFANQRGRI